jgi:uncharacterized membrane protein
VAKTQEEIIKEKYYRGEITLLEAKKQLKELMMLYKKW